MQNPRILALQEAIAPYRAEIVQHPLYAQMRELSHVQLFTEAHVFAVWDFMSLLKSLQQQLTCTTTPWVPKGDAATRFLINEIVTGEESDVDAAGNRLSHFELYLQAMQELGANTDVMGQFIHYVQSGIPVHEAMQKLHLPDAIQQFVNYTFHVIMNQPAHVQAAVFTFGREDLIPDMFHALVTDLNQRFGGRLKTFQYYLERHIEVDGDHHSQLALQMVERLCGDDAIKWAEATKAAIKALQRRTALWNLVLERMQTPVFRN